MKYTLDSSGFIFAVAFGCYLENCREYNGEVPSGYRTLDEWSTYACIQAYYIDSNGNLTLDSERLEELEKKQAQEAIDYAPLVRKDLFEYNEVLDSQYIRQTASGKVIVLEDIKTLAPRVKLTNVQPYEYDKITIYTQGKNMLPCIAKTETIEGVKFTKNPDGSLSVVGTALQDIEYVVAESSSTIFSLKAHENYFLNLGGLNCEMRFVDNGEIAQQYVGASGLINVPEHIEVSQVVIKIAKLESVNTTFYPQLEYGESFSSYAEYKCKTFEVNMSDIVERYLVPSDSLFPSDTLLLKEVSTIEYIIIKDNALDVSISGLNKLFAGGAFGLFSNYNTIYATKDIDLEIEYSTNVIDVNSLEFLQGKATTTNQFKILNDGSIEAHNGYFSGRIEADSGTFKGRIEADSGKIGSFNISETSIYTGKRQSYASTEKGVYIGDGGISVGGGDKYSNFSVNSDGDVLLNNAGSITFSGGTYSDLRINFNAIEFLNGTRMKYDSITIQKSIMDSSGFNVENTFVTNEGIKVLENYYSSINYSQLKHTGLTLNNSYSGNTELTADTLSFPSSANFCIKSLTEIMSFNRNDVKISSNNLYLGKSATYLGFFGESKSSLKKSVSTISSTSSATASTCATKINELINALKAYNLIG